MPKLYFSSIKDIFGTKVVMSTRDKKHSSMVAQRLQLDPLKKHTPKLAEGYVFRCPAMLANDWQEVFNSLADISGLYSINARLEQSKNGTETVYAMITFQEHGDAALFGWGNIHNWQKWSPAQEQEYRSEEKAKKNAKINIGKDGKITATVSITTLGN
jgi:hypothetical protein